ncbi:hypothetical protein SDJN02_27771, partial [Cucurbita argyrosperma subsp. argyrosperma]
MAPEVGEVPHANNHKREPLGRIIHKLRNILIDSRYYELGPNDPPYAAKFYDCCGAEDAEASGCTTSFHTSCETLYIESFYDEQVNGVGALCHDYTMKRVGCDFYIAKQVNGVGALCHYNDTMKRVGCDFHVEMSKAATLKWSSFGQSRAKTYECYDATEEDGASSNITSRQECQR